MTTRRFIEIPTDDVEVAAHLERVADGAGARVVTLTQEVVLNDDPHVHPTSEHRWVTEWEGVQE